MPGSTVVLNYDGTNIISDVLYPTARFESQLNAIPGTFSFTVKDVGHTHSFVTGKEVELIVDGTALYGGYVLQVQRHYPFPAMDTFNVEPEDTARYWTVRGVDYNILFDKRVLRYPTDYTSQIPGFDNSDLDGALIRLMCSDYLDIPVGFDTDTFVDDIQAPYDPDDTPTASRAWKEQGTKFREQVEDFVQFTGALYYFDADKNLHHHAIEDSVQRWGFSDQPNNNAITTSPASYQGSTIGPREVDGTEAGAHMVNDAMIWGGSALGASDVVFAREEHAGSISTHGRWQLGEVHFGEDGYKLQQSVDAKADLIVNGSPGAVGADQNRGLRFPQWSFRFSWFAHQVPTLSGTPNHLRPGSLATIELKTFGLEGASVQLLPLRSVAISFPQLDPSGNGYVRFDGQFGLQIDDPFTLWRFLLNQRRRRRLQPIVTVTNDSDSSSYGAYGQFTPSPAPDGVETVFITPFGYIAQTTQVFLFVSGEDGGVLLRRGIEYTETDAPGGEITLATAPDTGDELVVTCRTLA